MNKNILKTTYIFAGLFVILVIYLICYQTFNSHSDINNSYNKRQDLFSKKVVRGTIYSKDMDELAVTIKDSDNTEKRTYPYDDLFCHVVGSFDMGKSGLELAYNFELLESEEPFINKILADINNEKVKGNNIVTTLSVDLQKVCSEQLKNYKGAIVIMDAVNGDILAMCSNPGFNPNEIASIWDQIKNDNSGCLVNRATSGLYPPGSTFKLFTLGNFLNVNKDYASFSYKCLGTFNEGDTNISCSNKRAHGTQDLTEAFANSCNCAFVNIGSTFDFDQFNEYCSSKLFNSKLPLEIEYKSSKFLLKNNSSDFLKSQTVIGQGETLVTPIHMCMVMSSIANDGILMKPRLVTSITDYSEKTVKEIKPVKYKDLYSKEDARTLQDFLTAVVDNGTATRLKNTAKKVYGKTGTAQLSSTDGIADSWFVGAIETEHEKKYAFSIVLENVDENTSPATAVAKQIIGALNEQ